MATPPPTGQPRRAFPSIRTDTLACLAAAALAAGLCGWSVRPAAALFSREPSGYYGLLTAGFRHGHLYVDPAPDPRLLALPDPYDPAANAPFRLHDMTLYRGRYYLYYGVTPVLVFFWPVAALTGWYPTEACAVAAFGLAGVVAGVGLLGALRRRYFPAAPLWALGLAAGVLVAASPALALTAQPDFYRVPIACAFGLFSGMLLAIHCALHSDRRPGAWLAVASLLFGLAVGARPNYLLGGIALLWPCVWLARRGEGRRLLGAALGPALLCGAGLAIYNFQRFGSVAEFGMRYQLAGADGRHLQLFGLRNLGPNIRGYLFDPGLWQRYFPFFSPGSGRPYGLLRYAPWAWLAVFAFWRPAASSDGRQRVMAATLASGLAANFLMLATFRGLSDRYATDYFPAALLLGGMGALALTAGRPDGRRLLTPGLAALGFFSMLTGLAIFAGVAPRSGALLALARAANGPTRLWERAHGIEQGDLELKLELPAGRPGATEPLLETGSAFDQWDRIQVTYLPNAQAQISLFHAGIGLLPGRPFSVPADRRVTVRVRAGSLLPPFGHPAFASWTDDQYETARREVRVAVDGRDVLRAALAAYPSPPQDVRVGRAGWSGDGVEGSFTGRVLAARRLPLEPPAPGPASVSAHLPVELMVLFPVDRPAGTEPLVQTGAGARSDLLSCAYDGPGRLRFAFDHFGSPGFRSEPIGYDPLQPHRLVVWLGSLAPAAAGPLARRITVLMDGKTVCDEEGVLYPAAPETICIGVNSCGATTAQARFAGLVLEAKSAASLEVLPALRPSSAEAGAVGLEVQFPTASPGAAEPLVATGVAGAGDILYVRYLDASHVSFGFDHWGVGGITGPPVEIDFRREHRLALTMDALYPGGRSPVPFSGVVRVLLDGAVVLDGSSPCHTTRLDEIRIGRNPLGGSTSGPAFTGRIVAQERKPPDQLFPLPRARAGIR